MAKTKPAAAAAAAASAASNGGGSLSAAVLFKVVEATKSGGTAYVSQAEGEGLVNAGLIEVNPAMVDPNDGSKVAARATEDGLKYAAENGGDDEPAASEPAKAKPSFTIRDDVPLAPRRGGGGGGRESIYPFDALNVGQSFHVAKSADVENPARTMATAVSQAVRKHAVEDGFETDEHGNVKKNKAGEDVIKWKPTKVFTVRQVGADDPDGEGARIYRTA